MTTLREKAKKAHAVGQKRAYVNARLSPSGEEPIDTTGEAVDDFSEEEKAKAQHLRDLDKEAARREIRRSRMGFYSTRDR